MVKYKMQTNATKKAVQFSSRRPVPLPRPVLPRLGWRNSSKQAGFCPAPKSASGLRQVSTSQLGAHTGALEAGFGGRSCRNFVRSPGPATTYQGHAQVTGILKDRSQDFFLAATHVLEPVTVCSTSVEDTGRASGSTTGGSASAGSGSSGVFTSCAGGSLVVAGVFDGHGGHDSARYAHKAMLDLVANDSELHQSLGTGDSEATSSALKSAYSKVDEAILALSRQRAAAGRPHEYADGTTALLALQLGGLLAVANAGDSRAVLCREGQAVRLSRDHTPALRSERQRIEAAGGAVMVARGATRVVMPRKDAPDVMRALSVSRSLGDTEFKDAGLVVSEPEVAVVPLQRGRDAFLIAASDGLWSAVGDQQAVDEAARVLEEYSRMSVQYRTAGATAAARQLLKLALDSGSTDDVTVVVTVFGWRPEDAEDGGVGN